MRNTNDQVRGFHKARVKLSDDDRADIYAKAKSNRTRLRNGLAANDDPSPVGLNTQGSYAMRSMIQDASGNYDIDDGVYFRKQDLVGPQGGDKTALAARQMVCNAVKDERFNRAPEVHKNCVRVFYNEGYHVDLPVYRRAGTTNRSQARSTSLTSWSYELASTDWKPSDALSVTKWFNNRNSDLCSNSSTNGDSGQFVRVVRLMKAFARSRPHWGKKTASGFAISRLVSDEFVEAKDRDDIALRDTMRKIKDRLVWNSAVRHPTLNEDILAQGSTKAVFLRKKFEDKLGFLDVLYEVDCSHEDAMAAWDRVFYSDWFRAQPEPDSDDELGRKTSGPAVVKRGQTRYA
jgi:hypothetical protein